MSAPIICSAMELKAFIRSWNVVVANIRKDIDIVNMIEVFIFLFLCAFMFLTMTR